MRRLLLCLVALLSFSVTQSQLTQVVNEFYGNRSSGEEVYRIFAELDDDTDFVSSIFAAADDALYIGSDLGGIVNEALGSHLGDQIPLGFCGFVADICFDSYVTIGYAGNNAGTYYYYDGVTPLVNGTNLSALATAPSSNVILDSFSGAGTLPDLNMTDGSWFSTNTAGFNAQGLPFGPDNRVLLAQVAIPLGSTLEYELNIQLFDEAIGSNNIEYVWNPLTVSEGQEYAASLKFPGVSVGCTDATACNYDSAASTDDGSCIFPGCMDTTACNYDSVATCDSGDCQVNDECGNCGGSDTAGCTDSTACNYDSTAGCDDGSCLENDECGNCGGSDTSGCIDTTACNYDSTAECDDGSCLYDDICGVCGGTNIAGCVDPTACNFNIGAGCDDGSCGYPGCTDSTACNYDSTACADDGSCLENDECGNCGGSETAGCTDSTACNYDSTAGCDDGSCLENDECGNCGGSDTAGCTDSTACNYDSTAGCDDGSCLENDECGNCGGSDTAGCTDSTACNYDSTAGCDDGSCLENDECGNCGGSDTAGCTDSTACNYDSTAGCDDGSCLENDECGNCGGSDTAGCTDSSACNYDVSAVCDDGSCEYTSCAGCTNEIACNYDSEATIDDGLCEYISDPVVDLTDGVWILSVQLFCAGDPFESPIVFGPDQTVDGVLGSLWSLCNGELNWINGSENNVTWDGEVFTGIVSAGGLFDNCITVYQQLLGCTDSTACNYDSLANTDDGSCLELDECGECGGSGTLGCTDSTACNYDSTAGCDDGSCLENDECGNCGGSDTAGCTDSTACNYDSTAGCDDGSCLENDECGNCGGSDTAGCTDSTACNYDSTAGCDDGSCLEDDECGNCGGSDTAGCTDSTACNYDSTAGCDDGSCLENDECGNCGGSDTAGCTDSTACNYDSTAGCDDGSCLENDECGNCGGSDTAGCTDSTACNYDSTAGCDDGSCLENDECGNCGGSDTAGCTDSTACNYDSTAGCDDGSCLENDECGNCGGSDTAGCTDSTACNYDSTATCDDSSCDFDCQGCTDSTACNYDSTASADDGSCVFPDGCTDSTACNYDSTAGCDDGSCCFESCITLDMTDSFGDGWNQGSLSIDGIDYTILDVNGESTTGEWTTFPGGFAQTEDLCLDLTGCIEIVYTPGAFASENGFTLTDAGGTILASMSSGSSAGYSVNIGDPAECPIYGCTDSLACNYDSAANTDDGSCCLGSCITLDMTDSFGDGWNGATYEITLDGVSVATGDLDSAQSGDGSSFGTDVLCLADGCGYEITVAGGTFESEITWTLSGADGGSVSGGAPDTASFDAGCAIPGCTDSTACNYDSTATTDDGSCLENDECGNCGGSDTAGCTDSTACNYDSTAGCDDGSCLENDECGNCGGSDTAGCTDSTACNYDSTAGCDDGSCLENDECGNCGGSDTAGCTDSTACNYDSTAGCDDGSCLENDECGNCGGSDTAGCTDSTACNYDSTAGCDDGSCLENDECGNCGGSDTAGCTDSTACNYDSTAGCDDGSCLENDECGNCGGSDTAGCTDSTACNYDSTAGCDDGSCLEDDECGNCGGSDTAGCTDSTACNYDSTAGCDDGSCLENDECGNCGGSDTAGCTDSTACNYDSTAGCDDGSCLENDECGNCGGSDTAGCTDSTACNYDSTAGCDDGSCLENDECGNCGGSDTAGCTDSTACNYDSTAGCDDGSCLENDECGNCGGSDTAGCTDSTACNYDSTAGCDDGSCLENDECGNCGGSDTAGCTDSTACNYDSTAGCDDGSCLENDECGNCGGSDTAGCTDSTACNYDSTAGCDDGSCLENDECGNCGGSDTAGCTDSTACNYDSTAGCDDGSCLENDECGNCGGSDTAGCTDSTACNYDSTAGCDDSSCEYGDIVCPEDANIECGSDETPEALGYATLDGDCEFSSEPIWSDAIEGDGCDYTITRTWSITLPNGEDLTCSQIINVSDSTGPVFTNSVEDLTVECLEDVPAQEECTAEDVCNSVIELGSFDSETGNATDSCVVETAIGPGADWSIWLPMLVVDEIAPSAYWNFVGGEGYMVKYDDGTAHLWGTIENDEDNSLTFELDMWFENAADWATWSGLGRWYKDDLNLATPDALYEDWTYYELANIFSTLTGTGDLAGSQLYMTHNPVNYFFGFQCGEAANNKNSNMGFSGWFNYFGQVDGIDVEGNGDLNVDKECVPYNLQECPNDDEFTYMWFARDDCDNITFATQVITVDDITAPVFDNCPEDLEVECDTWPIPVAEDISATDNCEGDVEVVYVGETLDSDDGCTQVYTRGWIATDLCGNIETCTQTITVVDTTAPTFTSVPADVTIECDQDVPTDLATGEDNCQLVTASYTDVVAEGDCPQEYTITRTHILDDGCDNTSEVMVQIITVVDTTPPVFDDYSEIVTVNCEDLDEVEILTATDNCDEEVEVEYEDVFQSGGCPGVVQRFYTATDDCGNETTIEQYITLTDTEAPVIDNPADETIECDELDTLIDPESIDITDNCDDEVDVIFTETIVEGVCEDSYTIIWNWTAEDDCENVSEATTTITVQDTQGPEWTGDMPEDIVVECDEEVPAHWCPDAIDNCDNEVVIELTENVIDGDCPQEYTLERICRAFDNCGNMAIHVYYVNIVDTTAPEMEQYEDWSYECDETIPVELPEAVDNCGDSTVSYVDGDSVDGDGTCSVESSFVRTYTAEDECGNTSTMSHTIWVVDTTAPVFDEYEVNIEMPCDQIDDAVLVSATDNCSEFEITYEDEVVSGGCAGTVIRAYTAIDACGNESYAEQIINLTDVVAPEFDSFPADDTVECDDIPAVAESVTASDNCDDDVEITYQGEETIAGDCEGNYTLIRTWVATDNCFNETTQSQTITVVDTTSPEFTEFPADFTIECSETMPDPETPVAEDNCDDDVTLELTEETEAGDCEGESTLSRIWRAFDNCGNEVIMVQEITIVDTTAPEFTFVPADVTYECDEDILDEEATAEDNCSSATIVVSDGEQLSGDCPAAYSFVRTFTATDDCGNEATATQNITVVDTTPPVFDEYEVNIEMPCDQIDDAVLVSATDNCSEFEITYEDEVVSGGCAGVVIRAYTATDACGNESYAEQIINLTDVVAPEFDSFPADDTVECDDIPAVAESVTASDNCDDEVEITYQGEETIAGDCEGDYTLIRTWVATDNCFNETTQSQTITVIDTTAPEFTFIPEGGDYSCDADLPEVNAEAEDNCGEATVSYVDATTPGDCPNSYTVTRTFTAIDDCGNESSESIEFNIYDDEAPEITGGGDLVVECDGNGNLDEFAAWLDNNTDAQAIDNCGDVTWVNNYEDCTINIGDFTTYKQGDFGSGADSDASLYMDTNFDLVFPDGIVTGCVDDGYHLTFTSADAVDVYLPCTGSAQDLVLTMSTEDPDVDAEDPTCFDNALVSHLLTAKLNVGFDLYDPSFSASDVALEDLMPIQGALAGVQIRDIIDIADSVLGGCSSEYTPQQLRVALRKFNRNFRFGTMDEGFIGFVGCLTESETELGCGATSSTTVTFTAMDDCGNASSVTYSFTIEDTAAPVFDEYETNLEMPCDDIDDNILVTATDDCSDVTITYEDEAVSGGCAGVVIRSYTAVDECGNESYAEQIINLTDTTDPVLTGAPDDLSIECGDDIPQPAEVTADDNCDDELEVIFEETIEDLDCLYEIHRTWTVTDHCGNSDSATQIITLIDTTAPEFEGTDYSIDAECDENVEIEEPFASDICDEAVDVTVNVVSTPGSCDNEWTEVHTFTATDDCGNSSELAVTINYSDNTAPVFDFVPDSYTAECDDVLEMLAPTATDNCGEVTIIEIPVQESLGCDNSYLLTRAFIATDACGNQSAASQVITVLDTTPPVVDPIDDISVECEDELPDFSDWIAVDNCDPNPIVTTSWDFLEEDDCGNYIAEVTCTATDACGNSASTSFFVTVEDNSDPVLVDAPEDLVLDCEDEVPAAVEVFATDNCDDNIIVSYEEEIFGDIPDPDALQDCDLISPVSPYYSTDWTVWLQDFPGGYEYYTLIDGEMQTYADGTMHITGSVESTDDAGSGWNFDVWFMNGMDWDSWSTQDFPTSYKCDFNDCGDNYLDWMYYIMNGDMASMTGWGGFAGSTLTLSHAPSNLFYGYQVGAGANNVNSSMGSGGWFYFEGIFVDPTGAQEDVSGAGDFAFDQDCCPQYWLERTWCAEDCSGNITCHTQTISFEDLDVDGGMPGLPGDEPTALLEVKGDFDFVAVKPNPSRDVSYVEFQSNTNNSLTLEVYDMSGRKIATLFQGNVQKDVLYKSEFQVSGLESGLYNIRLFSLSHQVNEKLVVSK